VERETTAKMEARHGKVMKEGSVFPFLKSYIPFFLNLNLGASSKHGHFLHLL